MPLLLLAYLGFISLGLPDGMLGVGWPHIRAEFGEPVGAVGFVLFVGIAGYLLSSVAAGFSVARIGVGWLLAGSTGLAAAALAGYAASPVFATVVVAAFVLGIGSGAIDAGLNAYAARWFGARHMNWMHASFGLGATLGPLVMTGAVVIGLGWRGGYGTVAAGQVLLAAAFVLTVRAWHDARPADDAATARLPAVRVAQTLALPAVWRGAAAFAVYVGIEVGAGLWAYTLLTEDRGLPETVAGPAVSAYWGSLFVGRVILGVIAERAGTHRVLTGSMVGIAVGAGLVALPAPGWLAVVGLMLVGLSAAPVFPLLTLTTAERVGDGHADRTIGVQGAAAGLGGTVLPAGIGVLIGRLGPEVLGPSLVVLALVLAVLYRRPRINPCDAETRNGGGDCAHTEDFTQVAGMRRRRVYSSVPYRWIDAALAQLYQHGIEPYEVMQVLHGRRPRWPRPTISAHGLRFVTVWGRTSAGRAMAVTIRHEGDRDWLIVGAQELTLAERAEFEKWERGHGESS